MYDIFDTDIIAELSRRLDTNPCAGIKVHIDRGIRHAAPIKRRKFKQ